MAKKTRKPARQSAARKPKPATRKPPAKAAKRSAAKARPASAPAGPSPRQVYLDALDREHQTTLKLMRSFPADQGGFRPHERSSTAKRLMWTFAAEQNFVLDALKGTLTMPPNRPPEPDTVEEAIANFEQAVTAVLDYLKKSPDSVVYGKAPFFAGPGGKIAEYELLDLLWFMLMDQIHHRGQLSVYTRMAGGKVPSIYGPSADEPWR